MIKALEYYIYVQDHMPYFGRTSMNRLKISFAQL